MKKISVVILLIVILTIGATFGASKFQNENYTIESFDDISLSKDEFSSKLPNDGGYIKYDMYSTELDNVLIRFFTKSSYDIDIFKSSLPGADFVNHGEIDYSRVNNSDGTLNYYQCTFEKYGTYMVEIKDQNSKLVEKFPIFIGGFGKALEADRNNRDILKVGENEYIDSFITSNYSGHKASITSDERYIYIDGAYSVDNQKYMLYDIKKEGSKSSKIKDVEKINSKGIFDMKIRNNLSDGDYIIGLYTSDKRNSTFHSFIYNVKVKVEDDLLYFEKSPVLDHNKRLFDEIGMKKDPQQYLVSAGMLTMDSPELIELADKITKNKETDYEKILAIHDWVAENIYYDFDSYYAGTYPSGKAIDVLNSKKSVCEGYANLTASLARLSGIPCRKVSGYALGISSQGKWTDENINNDTNHAWNEAYVDGKWIILDTTWSSRNKFQKGKFDKKEQNRQYFDSTMEFFSLSHRIEGY